MEESDHRNQKKTESTYVTAFPVPFTLEENQENLTINTNTPSNASKEEIINQAYNFYLKGNIPEATKLYQYFINQGFTDYRVFSNY